MPHLLFMMIVLIGVVTSYEDVKYGKIRNRWILFGFLYAVIIYAYTIVVSNKTDTLPPLLINALFSILLAYILWHFRLWSAGDAKLFFVFSFLIPVNYYTYTYFSFFPAVTLLINIFVPVSLLLMIVIISYFFRNAQGKGFNAFEKMKSVYGNRYDYIYAFTGYFTVLLLVQLLVGRLPEALKMPLGKNIFILNLLVFVLIYKPLFAQFKKKEFVKVPVWFLALFLIYGFMFSKTHIFPQALSTLKMAVLFMALTSALLSLFQFYADSVETATIKAKDLRSGNLLTETAIAHLQAKCGIEKYYPDGLTPDDVQVIQSVCEADEGIQVYKTIPYAPIAFLGAVLTLTFQTSVIHFLLALVRNP